MIVPHRLKVFEDAIRKRDFQVFAEETMKVPLSSRGSSFSFFLLRFPLSSFPLFPSPVSLLFSCFRQDSNQFHAICLDTYPPIFYLNDVSKQIIQVLTRYNALFPHIKVPTARNLTCLT